MCRKLSCLTAGSHNCIYNGREVSSSSVDCKQHELEKVDDKK